MEKIRKEIDLLRHELKSAPSSRKPELFQSLESYKIDQYNLEWDSQDILLQSYLKGQGNGNAGIFIHSSEEDLIILSVGKIKDEPDRVFIFVNPEGAIDLISVKSRASSGLEPTADQSHPNPADFKTMKDADPANPGSYLYGAQTPGFGLRHEIKHSQLILGSSRRIRLSELKGKDGYSYDFRPLLNTTGNQSEYDTDKAAMADIRKAWERWKDSGYKDDSGYYFIFRLPEGGYILTKNDSESYGKDPVGI